MLSAERSERWAKSGAGRDAAAKRAAARTMKAFRGRRFEDSNEIIGFLNCISFFVHSRIWLVRIYFSRSGLHGFSNRGRNAEVAEGDSGHPVDRSLRFSFA